VRVIARAAEVASLETVTGLVDTGIPTPKAGAAGPTGGAS
jgi:hypothetical protein